jgi:putative peptide zinc metalloprotease protein
MEARDKITKPLPKLLPYLKLFSAPSDPITGEPVWTIHNPYANTYFYLKWAEFEVVSRLSRYKNSEDLKHAIHTETQCQIEDDDIEKIIQFLNQSGLLAYDSLSTQLNNQPHQSLWKKFLHGYLFFTIPLVKPQKFLERTLPAVLPLLSSRFFYLCGLIFLFALILTAQRSEEFFHTFSNIFSLEGFIQIAIVFGFIKIIHEMAHAYTAVKHGVNIPHMGVAFMVLYPMLYTETSGSWQLAKKSERFSIGFAGIRAELCLSAFALLLWNFVPAGSVVQSLCFMVVTIALISSLLINLNPLMRFDGYYMLSDALGYENLQARSCAFARWKIRKFLFSSEESPPEDIPTSSENFMVRFGIALLIYRFFLFVGIAIAVYHIFFKPLGLILMVIELWLFIFQPCFSEFKIWWSKRAEYLASSRTKVIGIMAVIILLIYSLPIHREVIIPAVLQAEEYQAFFPPSSSVITEINVIAGQKVSRGDTLMVLQSLPLEKEHAIAQAELDILITKRRLSEASKIVSESGDIISDEELNAAEELVTSIESKRNRLIISAPFDGEIRDFPKELQIGQAVNSRTLLFRLINPQNIVATAYVSEADIERIRVGDEAIFIPNQTPLHSWPMSVSKVDSVDSSDVSLPELSSCYGGNIQSDCSLAKEGKITPLLSLYKVDLKQNSQQKTLKNYSEVGQIHVEGRYYSPIFKFIKMLANGILREIGLS